LQIVADALGKTLLIAPDPEASLRGAALVTLARVGDQPLENLARAEIAEWARVVPRPDVTVGYRRIRAELRALAEGLERAVEAEGS
jgi:sugar (pentulose or hexulose) kinase